MFVKMYRYKLQTSDFPQWQRIIELDYYPSKQAYLTTTKQVADDPEITSLFNEFLKTVRDQRFTEEEFETL